MESNELNRESITSTNVVFDECVTANVEVFVDNNEINNNENNERNKECINNRVMKYLLDSNNKSNRYLKSDSIYSHTSGNSTK